jgi:AcrR family transcriptional regulator
MVAKSSALRQKSSAPAAQRASAQLPLRDAERTRRAILKAATAEFAEWGLAGARVDKIAEVSALNKRMLYYYFNSKDDLYLAVLENAYIAMDERAQFEAREP